MILDELLKASESNMIPGQLIEHINRFEKIFIVYNNEIECESFIDAVKYLNKFVVINIYKADAYHKLPISVRYAKVVMKSTLISLSESKIIGIVNVNKFDVTEFLSYIRKLKISRILEE